MYVTFQYGGQITDFHFRHFDIGKISKKKKNTFRKQQLFNEIWTKLEDHKYININEIKFDIFFFIPVRFKGYIIFLCIAKM